VGEELRDKSGQVVSLQAKTENILESMRDGLVSTDSEGFVSELNSSGAAILGLKPEELRGRPIQSLFRDSQIGVPSLPNGNPFPTRREMTYLHPRGGHRILGVSASPLIVPEIGAV